MVLERADCLRTAGAAFNMWPNAWKALDALGVSDSLRPFYPQIDGNRGFSVCSGVCKNVSLKREGKGDSNVKPESRCIEIMVLLEASDSTSKLFPYRKQAFSFHHCRTCRRNIPHSKGRNYYLHNNKLKLSAQIFWKLSFFKPRFLILKCGLQIVIGCDGVYSVVARYMGLPTAKSVGCTSIRGMVTYPQGHHFEKLMVQVWGKGLRTGFVTCTDQKVYWFLTRKSQPRDAEMSGDAENVRTIALEMVKDFPEPIAELIKLSPAETINMADLKVRWVWPWDWGRGMERGKGSVTIVGDALHPMTPDLGQGACMALEDAVHLSRCLEQAIKSVNMVEWGEVQAEKIESCFNKYLKERRWRVSSITSAAFVIGFVQEGSSKLARFVRDWIFFPLFSMRFVLYFAESCH